MFAKFLNLFSSKSLRSRKIAWSASRIRSAQERLEDRLAPAAPPPLAYMVTSEDDNGKASETVKGTLRYAEGCGGRTFLSATAPSTYGEKVRSPSSSAFRVVDRHARNSPSKGCEEG
jgi:hypothetical protein